MNNQSDNQKYELEIKPKDVKEFKKCQLFNDDTSSDEEIRNPAMSYSSKFKKRDTSKLEEALKEDPTIFDYDGVYEKVSTGKSKVSSIIEKPKPKFAHKFIKSAEMKNMRYQVTLSKKARMENESDPKEIFVSNTYKKEQQKLLELAREDQEQEEREKKLELAKKPGSMDIYRHMLEEKLKMSSKSDIKQNVVIENKKPNLSELKEVTITTSEVTDKPKDNLPEESEIVKSAIKAKLIREKAAQLLQKPDPKKMLSKFTKKNDDTSINNAYERYLQRKNIKRPFIEEDGDSD